MEPVAKKTLSEQFPLCAKMGLSLKYDFHHGPFVECDEVELALEQLFLELGLAKHLESKHEPR